MPATISGAVRLSARDGALRRVLLLSGVCGFSLSTLELFGPPLFAGLAGSTTGGSGLFGVVMSVSFLAGAVGSLLAPRARRTAGGSTRAAVTVLVVLSGVAIAGVAVAPTVLLAAGAYAAFYLGNAATFPLLHGVLHGRVGAEGRATTLSAESLCLQLGGAVSGLLMPALAAAAGGSAAVFLMASGVAVLSGLLALGLPSGDQALLPAGEQGRAVRVNPA